ncbi:MAG: cache domain-containing protein, partial [Treponema sp.]|nr:cache domain-containing protein [Treponema sp.]
MKISVKLTAIMCALGVFAVGAVGITLLVRSRTVIYDLSDSNVKNLAESAVEEIEKHLEVYWDATETLSQVFKHFEAFSVERRRTVLNELVRGMVIENPELISVWCCWEPNVLEGNDLPYIGTPGTDTAGRFAPYWFRNGNNIELDILAEYDVPGSGDYYLLARNSGKGQLLEPYWYEFGGKSILITSVAFPILSREGNRVIGVVGMDVNIDALQKLGQDAKPYAD